MTEAIWVALIVSIGGSLVNGYFILKAARAKVKEEKAKKLGDNPHPCASHAKWLKELDDKIDSVCERISRIEGRLNGMK